MSICAATQMLKGKTTDPPKRAGLRPTVQRRVLLAMEGAFDDVSVEKAEKAGYANKEE